MTAPRVIRIGRDNSTFQTLKSLKTNRNKRHRNQLFVVEGVEPMNSALAERWSCEALISEVGGRLSTWALGVLRTAGAPVHYELDGELIRDLSGKSNTSELLGVFRMKEDRLERISLRPDLIVAVVDRPSNNGNLGTFIRSCDAFGVHGVIVSGHSVDVYDPSTITASRGAIFGVPIVRVAAAEEVVAWVGRVRRDLGECVLIGAETGGDIDVWRQDFRKPTIVVAGSERQGLSRAYRDGCDALVRIPMCGSVTSLNVGVATSILLYEITRQRQAE